MSGVAKSRQRGSHMRLFGIGKHARCVAERILISPKVSQDPHLDEETRAVVIAELGTCKVYLEYGAGGSTLLALRASQARVVSVESDKRYLEAVVQQVPAQHRDRLTPLYADIGVTGRWGRPLLSIGRDLKQYPQAPWTRMPSFRPDLILIDGRFRVACALESILHLPAGWTGRIVMDDYVCRPHLHVVEQFGEDVRQHGRSVSFRPARGARRELQRVLDRYYWDYR